MSRQAGSQPNDLINETSPYLLQHAYNPVKWVPFGDKAFETALAEKKLILISVGYSACHWCHVMEHESFEDEKVAEVMNRHFVCVKVDREERPDVDMLYMQAVQLMTGQGGWPLNCFVLPDGRPFYGGTYFNKGQWLQILSTLAEVHLNQPEKLEGYADELTRGIHHGETYFNTAPEHPPVTENQLKQCIQNWKKRFDNDRGGPNHAPKFPLPSNYLFLLRYAVLSGDNKIMEHVNLTLTQMAFGGINDQLHGGFARYSTDMLWKVPHFEKMLYDNSQLASLYLEAYTHTQNQLYAETARSILDFVEKEWLTPEGGFYSAYDADSEGEEGKYYVWNKAELHDLLGDDFPVFSAYYQVNETGYWEHGNYILMRNPDLVTVLSENNTTKEELDRTIQKCKEKLTVAASTRVKPALDDKVITAWNGMMVSAYCQASIVLKDDRYKTIALNGIEFISSKLTDDKGHLKRTYKKEQAKIHGFLDDYAFVIEAYYNCYLVSQDEDYLRKAERLMEIALELFNNPDGDFLYYTSSLSEKLVARSTETSDNVIPSSNAMMALHLFTLGHVSDNKAWIERAGKMLSRISEELLNHGPSYSHWGCLALNMVYPFREVAVVGKDVDEKLGSLYRRGVTNAIFVVSPGPSETPLLKGRFEEGKTLIYICKNSTCGLPVQTVEAAHNELEK
jgi:uncharacterized protein YyaL (SSP411 family)